MTFIIDIILVSHNLSNHLIFINLNLIFFYRNDQFLNHNFAALQDVFPVASYWIFLPCDTIMIKTMITFGLLPLYRWQCYRNSFRVKYYWCTSDCLRTPLCYSNANNFFLEVSLFLVSWLSLLPCCGHVHFMVHQSIDFVFICFVYVKFFHFSLPRRALLGI